jgi:hypothetical protein
VPFCVGEREVRDSNGLSSFSARVYSEHRHVSFVTVAPWSKVFSTVSRIKMPPCRHTSSGLAIWARAGPTIRLYVDMETTFSWRQVGDLRCDLQARVCVQ